MEETELRELTHTEEGVQLCEYVADEDASFSVVPRGDETGKITVVFSDGSYSPYWVPAEGAERAQRRERVRKMPGRFREAARRILLDEA